MGTDEKEGYIAIEMTDCLFLDDPERTARAMCESVQAGKDIVLDLAKVKNLHSSGMRFITVLLQKVLEKSSRLSIINASDRVECAIRSVRLDTSITIFGSLVEFEMEKEWEHIQSKVA